MTNAEQPQNKPTDAAKTENVAKFHAQIKSAYGKLSDEDIKLYDKQRDQFFVKLQEKQNVSKADSEMKLQDMEKSCGCGSANKAA